MSDSAIENNFQVVYHGVLPGFSHTDVRSALAKLFRTTEEKADKILASNRAIIKAGIDQTLGEKYLQKLSSIGIDAQLKPEPALVASTSAYEAPVAPVTATGGGAERISSNAGAATKFKTEEHVPFIFTGNGFEYFKIWIVNILLSVITLGIYSAWAKVRNKQYFYGNTLLDGASFSYTANPVQILIGRIIAFVFFVVYAVAGELSVVAGMVMGGLLIIVLPWVICKSLRFNAHYTQYRNVPFVFRGRLGQAAMAFLLWPLLGVLTLGILMPYAFYQQQKFIYGNHSYGTAEFDFRATVGAYYGIFLLILGIFVVGGIAAFVAGMVLPLLAFPVIAAMYLVVFAYFVVATSNLNYNNIHVREHRFQAGWKVQSYLWLMLTNTLGILVTLGFFLPWARVRTARYKAKHTSVHAVGDLDSFAAAEREAVGPVGEGVGDLFDIEVGF
ncbi:YjgN family protein [uncultured Halopseudomonas sp.]|uniref:YjgN family protein n=1 Tax=uncultured Halopseudomonas sp. TaxID=2901193 RepID=UPI0030ED0DCE